MRLLINCSNLKAGGGLQVADSICGQLSKFKHHHFVVVMSSFMIATKERLGEKDNVDVFVYNIPNNIKTLLLGRDDFLDSLVERYNIHAVLSVFGPSKWCPKVPHLCGFARAQLLPSDSPFHKCTSVKDKLEKVIWSWSFRRCSRFFYTENSFVSKTLKDLFLNVEVYTVSNYYNQIFDMSEKWDRNTVIPYFNGITCLTVSTYSDYKNFEIIPDVIGVIHKEYPQLKVRFILTLDQNELDISEEVSSDIFFVGKKDISEIPYLYEQCDIMFMPSLLECFTATYPEAMRMEKPIVTPNLNFARSLCGDAACYYSAIDSTSAANAIYKVATDKEYANQLVINGKKQLLKYDNYEQRAEKLIHILEEIADR